MEPHELIKAIVAGVGERLKAENETLKTVLMAEIEAIREENKKEHAAMREESRKTHAEIMDKLIESNEINGKGLKQLEKRVAQLEEDNEFLPHSH